MNKEYDMIPDEELITRLRDGEKNIMDYIMVKYKYLAKADARAMYILGGENDDLIQEGMIGLFKAIRDYDSGRDASFQTFAQLCISRQIYTAVQASNRKKHFPLNTYISIYTESDPQSENTDVKNMMERLSVGAGESPEEMLIAKESVEQMERIIEKELSTFEKQVFDLYVTGMKTPAIAGVLSRDFKSTDNAMQRVRNKLQKVFIEK